MKMQRSKVSAKGWVVIPKEIRERHGIKPGDEVMVMEYGGQILLVPLPDDPIAAGRGMLAGNDGVRWTDELVAERRREREREEDEIERLPENEREATRG